MLEWKEGYNLKGKTEEVMKKGDKLIDMAMNSTEEEDEMKLFVLMSFYKSIKDLAVSQAAVLDDLMDGMNDLKLMNDRLLRRNEHLQELLQNSKNK